MDRNTFLAMGLSLLVITAWMMYEAEQQAALEQAQPPPVTVENDTSPERGGSGEGEAEPALRADAEERPAERTPTEREQRWVIETPLYKATLSSRGAKLVDWTLKNYEARQDEGGGPLRLVEPSAPAAVTSFGELGLGDLGRRVFKRSETGDWVFVREEDGVRVEKRFSFSPDNYEVALEVVVTNLARASLRPRFELAMQTRTRTGADFKDAQLSVLQREELEREYLSGFGLPGFLGFGRPEKERLFEDGVVWAGLDSRYFAAIVAPDVTRTASARLRAEEPGALSSISISYPGESEVPEGISLTRAYRLYIGPKNEEDLKRFGAQLERSIDLGWSWVQPITKGFIWLMRRTYEVIPNYGVAIILLTIALRLVMAPLTHKQMKVMRRNSTEMSALQPKIKEVQERYADDAQKKNEEMMKIYREAGVNPLSMMGGGCLPMLLQLPVFIALYYALQSAIELRGAPFGLWIHDLSIPETLFTLPGLEIPIRVLPLAMGASMVLQQKMTPTPSMDPTQARMMMTVMPIMFTVLFYGFPSGLVLYWFVSNLLGMAQQLVVNRQVK